MNEQQSQNMNNVACNSVTELPLFSSQFAVILSLVIIVQIAAAIAGYIFRNKVSDGIPYFVC